MANLNKVMLIGNLTADPEVRYTPKGTAVAEVSLAVNRTWVNDQNQKQEETTFVGVVFWGRKAELIKQYSGKGHSLYVEGRLTQEAWVDEKTGAKRSKTKVICDDMQFIGSPRPRQEAEPRRQHQPTTELLDERSPF